MPEEEEEEERRKVSNFLILRISGKMLILLYIHTYLSILHRLYVTVYIIVTV